MKTEREKFEKEYCKVQMIDSNGNTFDKLPNGDYVRQSLHLAWLMWQSAKSQAVPEGFVVVPIEITPEQIEAYMKGKVFPASMGEHRKFVDRLSKDYTAMISAGETK